MIDLNNNASRKANSIQLKALLNKIYMQKYLVLLSIPAFVLLIIFNYIPMYGIVIAFQKYNPAIGILKSPWVGFLHFSNYFKDPFFFRILRNTFLLGLFSLICGFPAPILLALLLNEVKLKTYKRFAQTISYLPNFISTVIIIGILKDLFSPSGGIVNEILQYLGLIKSPINFFGESEWFRPLYIGSGIWQGVGFGSIIYLAAIAGINPELYESALIDGANRWHQMIYITLPTISSTIIILFILAVGGILGNDFTKILLMYSPITYETADVIQTYVYRQGIQNANYSYASAVGLFMSLISFAFLFGTNYISKKVSETSLW